MRTAAFGQSEFERAPINYQKTPPCDPVTELQDQLDSDKAELEFDEEHGYLKSILEHLGISTSSQVLVYSKTSFQLRRISRRSPRALYFNEDSYVGWVQGGDVLEIMTTDPKQGAMFFTLSQEKSTQPKLIRDRGQCIICHASSRTQNVPGGLVRSVFVSSSGQPQYGAGTFNIDHTSPFKNRWGGWYVTGTHGGMRHMGNVFSKSQRDPEKIEREKGANITELSDRVDVSPYLEPHSDIVALMVLEHQVQTQNAITAANFECRKATHSDQVMNAILERPEDYQSDTTKRRIASVGDNLLKHLLFTDEFPLKAPVAGTSDFTKEFSGKGPRDQQGRSLRDFDLKTRMFRYPCSYMIYSSAFDQLPKPVKTYVITRLHKILIGEDDSDDFRHLTPQDRQAILEILTETKPGLLAKWFR